MRCFLAAARHKVPRLYIAHPRTDTLRPTSRAVAERRQRLEAIPDSVDRGADALGSHFVQDLADLIWATARFADHAFATHLHFRPLGSGADKGGLSPDEHLPVIELGSRHIKHAELAVLDPLRELLHSSVSGFIVSTDQGVKRPPQWW